MVWLPPPPRPGPRFRTKPKQGRSLWWCEEHDSPGGPRNGGPFDRHCYDWWICELLGDECDRMTPCQMVEGRFIIDGDS